MDYSNENINNIDLTNYLFYFYSMTDKNTPLTINLDLAPDSINAFLIPDNKTSQVSQIPNNYFVKISNSYIDINDSYNNYLANNLYTEKTARQNMDDENTIRKRNVGLG
jgi:hypothetical protein